MSPCNQDFRKNKDATDTLENVERKLDVLSMHHDLGIVSTLGNFMDLMFPCESHQYTTTTK